jgi:hypothetical protein
LQAASAVARCRLYGSGLLCCVVGITNSSLGLCVPSTRSA